MREGWTITVVTPALNEEAALPGVLSRLPDWVDRVVVADNGSTDGTARVAAAAGAEVVFEPRRGYGRACLAALAHVLSTPHDKPDIIVFLDADGSDSPEQMDRLVDPIVRGRADMVIGSRLLGGVARGAMTAPQRLGNWLAPALIRILWGARYSDLGPFRAIRSASLRTLHMDDQTFGWTVQMQIRAIRAGLRVVEAPVNCGPRRAGRSKISGTVSGVMRAGAKILGCVAQERLLPPRLPPRRNGLLGIMARYPEPGKAKTRLIPALGAERAASLHEAMLRHTIETATRLRQQSPIDVIMWGTGAQPGAFTARFDLGMVVRAQPDGDLGQRMMAAFHHMLRDAPAAALIGTDCPELSVALLDSAFDALQASDLVLGPASDGGYYLIGLRRPVPALFADVPWGGGDVLRLTVERAETLGLRITILPMLDDVDEPADLHVWDRVQSRRSCEEQSPRLSVVIPTLNEAARIGRLIDHLARPGVEIIVADGGSGDDTRQLAARYGAQVVTAENGRGVQMNAGARRARAPLLLFLHADTRLPSNYLEIVEHTLGQESIAVGAFSFALDGAGLRFRLVEEAVRIRCAMLRTPYGDQALFMRRTIFERLGGFDSIPLMEDLSLVRRARRIGRVVTVRARAVTSARRWQRTGVARMTAINQACVLGYQLGVPPERLAAWRNRWSNSGHDHTPQDVPVHQIVPEGSAAPSASRATCMTASERDVRK